MVPTLRRRYIAVRTKEGAKERNGGGGEKRLRSVGRSLGPSAGALQRRLARVSREEVLARQAGHAARQVEPTVSRRCHHISPFCNITLENELRISDSVPVSDYPNLATHHRRSGSALDVTLLSDKK